MLRTLKTFLRLANFYNTYSFLFNVKSHKIMLSVCTLVQLCTQFNKCLLCEEHHQLLNHYIVLPESCMSLFTETLVIVVPSMYYSSFTDPLRIVIRSMYIYLLNDLSYIVLQIINISLFTAPLPIVVRSIYISML